jgi:hypothetical protein
MASKVPTEVKSPSSTNSQKTPLEALLTQGGPGGAILHRLHLLQPQLGVGSRRTAVVLAAATWVPLLALSAAQGTLAAGASIPFIEDLAAHTRFLLAVPVLALAGIPIGFRLREMVRQFLNSGLVRDEERPRFIEILVDSIRIRDSRWAEIAVVVMAYITTYVTFIGKLQTGITWYKPAVGGHLFLAGYYYVLVALPIFQFLIYRWVWRMYIWARFLWKVSKLDLRLSAAHPDAAGGLGFLGKSLIPFGVLTFALSMVVSGAIASRVIFAGADLESFAVVYAVLLVITLIVFTGPVMIFTPRLIRLKYEGMLRYGVLADRYTRLFEERWMKAESVAPADESILGSGDIQSLADLGNSFELVRKMRVFPIEPSDVVTLLIPGLIPAVPLLLIVMPLSDILKTLFRMLA